MVRMYVVAALGISGFGAPAVLAAAPETTLHYCMVSAKNGNIYYSRPFLSDDDSRYSLDAAARRSAKAEHGSAITDDALTYCYSHISQSDYDQAIAHTRNVAGSHGKTVSLFTFASAEPLRTRLSDPGPKKATKEASTKPERDDLAPVPAPKPVITNEYGLPQTAEKKAKYEAEMAAYKKTLDEQARAADRAKAQQEANARAVQQARAEHEAEVLEANRRQQEYFAAQRRHAMCLGGDAQACTDINVGRPVTVAGATDPGKASTDTDARTCVSAPTVGPSPTYKGQTSAVVVNGCKTSVDVRICLMREGGWNCGVQWGIQPTDRWTWNSFKASGEVFWDARVSGSSTPLASPPAS